MGKRRRILWAYARLLGRGSGQGVVQRHDPPEARFDQGQRLVDFEFMRDGGQRLTGLWRNGSGAERLLGSGDMLFMSPDASQTMRLQGCFVSDPELDRLIHYWKHAGKEESEPPAAGGPFVQSPLPTLREMQEPKPDPLPGLEDELMPKAIEVIRKLSGVREPDSFPGWVKRIAVNKCLSYLRSPWHKRGMALERADGTPGVEPVAADHAAGVEAGSDLEAALTYLQSIRDTWSVDAFIASNRTRRYYFSDGTHKALDPDTPDE